MTIWLTIAARGHSICILLGCGFLVVLAAEFLVPSLRTMGRVPAAGLVVCAGGAMLFQIILMVMRWQNRERFDAAFPGLAERRRRHG
ncbi:MAG TPA: hypothetical protein VGF77_02380 [Allosphingosinicella sp.]